MVPITLNVQRYKLEILLEVSNAVVVKIYIMVASEHLRDHQHRVRFTCSELRFNFILV